MIRYPNDPLYEAHTLAEFRRLISLWSAVTTADKRALTSIRIPRRGSLRDYEAVVDVHKALRARALASGQNVRYLLLAYAFWRGVPYFRAETGHPRLRPDPSRIYATLAIVDPRFWRHVGIFNSANIRNVWLSSIADWLFLG